MDLKVVKWESSEDFPVCVIVSKLSKLQCIYLLWLHFQGEMLTVYRSLPYVQNDKIYSITLPNAANFAFDYYTFLILGVFPMYCTGECLLFELPHTRKLLN